MSILFHVVLKDHDNSGYIWDDFYCPDCLERWVVKFNHLEILRKVKTTPSYLSHLYPQLVTEPNCRVCGAMFKY